jgi:hypothetical protein
MRDITWHNRCGSWRRGWVLRIWWPHRLNRWWFSDLFGWVNNTWRTKPFEMGILSRRGWGTCYCPTGLGSEFWLIAAGFGLRLWCNRDRGPRPCLCELSLLEGMPESYPDELDENGGIENVRRLIEHRQEWIEKAGVR